MAAGAPGDKPPRWLRGSFPILPTPLRSDGSLDEANIPRLVEHYGRAGVGGVVALGSGGEGAYLTSEERRRVVAAASRRGVRIIAGSMQVSTVAAVEDARGLVDSGADGLLVNLPQYYRTPLGAVVAHYDAVVAAVDVPVLYYHYPAVTGLRLSPDELGVLFARVALAGTKESGVSTPELRRRLAIIERPIAVFTGLSFNLVDALDAGAVGAMSPAATLMPSTEVALIEAYDRGDRDAAAAAERRLFRALPILSPVPIPVAIARPVMRTVLRYGLPTPDQVGVPHAGVKLALHHRGLLPSAALRAPQPPLSDAAARRVRRHASVVEA